MRTILRQLGRHTATKSGGFVHPVVRTVRGWQRAVERQGNKARTVKSRGSTAMYDTRIRVELLCLLFCSDKF